MFWLILLLFVLGASIGSFLNVVVYRTMYGDSPFRGRSYCDNCKKQVDWKHNIPLLSFFLLKGRCAHCRKKISWQYPLVEFMTGVLFVWWFFVGRGFFFLVQEPFVWIQPIFWLLVGMMLLAILVFDLLYMVIPDFLSVGLLIWVLVYRLGLVWTDQMRAEDLVNSVIAGGLLAGFFLGLYLITKKRGFGLGDVKFAPALGLLLGGQRLLVAVFLAFVLGSLMGVCMLMMKKRKMNQVVPFGPFLVMGTVVSLLWGGVMWAWYWNMVL